MYHDHTLFKLTQTLHVLFLPTLLFLFLKYLFIQFKVMCRYVHWVHVCVPHTSRCPQRPVGVRTPGSSSSESPDLYAKKPTQVCCKCTMHSQLLNHPYTFLSSFYNYLLISFNSVRMGVGLSTGVWDLPVAPPLKKSDCLLPVIFTVCQLGWKPSSLSTPSWNF